MGKFFIYIFLVFIFSLSNVVAAKTFNLDCDETGRYMRVVGDKIQTRGIKTDFKWIDAVETYLVTWNSNEIVIGYDKPRKFGIQRNEYDRFRISTKKGYYVVSALFWHSSTYEEENFSFGICKTY